MAINYEFKTTIEDTVHLLRRQLDNSLVVEKSVTGEPKLNEEGDPFTFKDGKLRLKSLVDYTIEAIMYGQYRAKPYESKIKLYGKINPAKGRELRRKAKDLEAQRDAIEDKYENGEISSGERITLLAPLEKDYYDLMGKNLVWSKVGEKVLMFNQLKGLGYNFTAGIANFGFGILSNMVHANGRVDFDNKTMIKAFGVLTKAIRFKKKSKVGVMTEIYNVFFEIRDTEYGKNKKRKGIHMLSRIGPYIFMTATEFMVQAHSMIAQMMYKNITNADGTQVLIDGKPISVYDAYTEDGIWRSELFSDEVNEAWRMDLKANETNEFSRFRNKIIEVNKMLHGNYDLKNSPILLKKSIQGRMAAQFRSWVPEGFFSRLAKPYYNEQLGRWFAGRWNTYGRLGIMKSFSTLGKQLIYSKNAFIDKDGNIMAEYDIENMRKNLSELGAFVSLLGLALMLKAMLDDDDDDEKRPLTFVYKVLANQLWRVQADISFYLSPSTFRQVLQNPIAVMGIYHDGEIAINNTIKYLNGDYNSDEPLIDKWFKFFPFVRQIPKIKYQGTNVRL